MDTKSALIPRIASEVSRSVSDIVNMIELAANRTTNVLINSYLSYSLNESLLVINFFDILSDFSDYMQNKLVLNNTEFNFHEMVINSISKVMWKCK